MKNVLNFEDKFKPFIMKFLNTLLIFVCLITLTLSCKKAATDVTPVPVPSINDATLVTVSPTIFNPGRVMMLCNTSFNPTTSTFNAYGFCYSTLPNPTYPASSSYNNSYNSLSSSFSGEIINLESGKTYYVRSFIQEGNAIKYGNEITFLMPSFITTDIPKKITTQTFDINITLSSSITTPINQRGVCFSTSPNPTKNNSVSISPTNGTGLVTINVFVPQPGTIYYVRSFFITNNIDVFYGNEVSFKSAGYIGGSGSYVFFDKGEFTNGWRYLEASPNPAPTANTLWGCSGTFINGIQSTIGNGLENSNAIVASCNFSNVAARVCRVFTLNNKTDWFLPSIDELKALYLLKISGLINNSSSTYYSSTQISSTDCLSFNFNTGQQVQISKNNNVADCWPARRF
jgi:hypothetical protein